MNTVTRLCLIILFAALPSLAAAQTGDLNRPPAAQRATRNGSSPTALSSQQGNAQPPVQPTGAEKELFEHVNESRVLAGLSALHWDAKLAAAAHKHCALLVQHDALSHQFPGEPDLKQRLNDAGAEFSVAAENVAVAPTPEEVHYEWMHSPPHRANILDPDLTSIGIAALPGNKGLFAVQDFAHSVEQLSFAEQEEKVRALIAATGVHTADNPEHTNWSDARRTCNMGDGYAGKPGSVTHFETWDLSELPAKLKAALSSGRYRTAAVAACAPTNHGGGFAQYRLVVLLY